MDGVQARETPSQLSSSFWWSKENLPQVVKQPRLSAATVKAKRQCHPSASTSNCMVEDFNDNKEDGEEEEDKDRNKEDTNDNNHDDDEALSSS
ncbi:hypothetical protein PGTUg99_025773 [Puccinia graminis f. sp. tritici]|uniref:Uncharacterized protein n=1 Tax=Puccinia graminis f. sp. tritici TaxID=56615 RepID=A0A5B0PME7_PUCGR|nr:hypothetical protein PGTUg99_025773 [Puccinia graminis f. sp. tritici]